VWRRAACKQAFKHSARALPLSGLERSDKD
jgi:hypothetical protein